MSRCAWCLGSAVLALAFAGCDKPASPASVSASASPEAQSQVRGAFAELQAAIKGKNAEKLWGLLSVKSHTDAEQVARDLRAAYEKAGPAEKPKQAEKLGLKAEELANLTGQGFLRTKRFRDKYDDIEEGKITKVTVQGDSATVYFDEPDGDHEKAIFLREEGKWKAWMTMPKTKQP